MAQVESEEFTDDGSITPQNPQRPAPSVNNTTRDFLIDEIKNYTTVTVQNAGVISCTAWDYDAQSWGKIIFYATGTVLVDSSSKITATGKGYKGGGYYYSLGYYAYQGESYTGEGSVNVETPNAGGGGARNAAGAAGAGGYGTKGSDGAVAGSGGETYGTPTLDVLYRGSGGGGKYESGIAAAGLDGGGIIMISADSIVIQGVGSIEADGNSGVGAGGSGGSIYLKANNLDVGIGKVTAVGSDCLPAGGDGRIRFDYINKGPSESDPTAYKFRL